MPVRRDEDFLKFVLDQLASMPSLTSRRMFGAIGIYHGLVFFAIIDEGILYFATDESTRVRYEARGMKPFEYAPGKVLRTYYPVPVDVLEDDAELRAWARDAVDAQRKRAGKKLKKAAARYKESP